MEPRYNQPQFLKLFLKDIEGFDRLIVIIPTLQTHFMCHIPQA